MGSGSVVISCTRGVHRSSRRSPTSSIVILARRVVPSPVGRSLTKVSLSELAAIVAVVARRRVPGGGAEGAWWWGGKPAQQSAQDARAGIEFGGFAQSARLGIPHGEAGSYALSEPDH